MTPAVTHHVSSLFRRLAVVVGLVGVLTVGTCLWVRPSLVAMPVVPDAGYGFSVGAPQSWMSDADADRELDAVARTRAEWMRVLIDWHIVEPVKGQYNWHYVDHWVNGSKKRGLKVLGLIAYSPTWARAPGSYFSAPPVNPADYAAFVMAVVQRYGDRVAHWEIWNEPNLPLFFGFTDNRAAVYTELLKAAYPAIKAIQPDATVIAAGLSRATGSDAPTKFLADMYANGARKFFDATAMHPYVFPGGIAEDGDNGWSDLVRVHDLMTVNGDGDKKVWMTELGASTCAPQARGVSQDEQARQILQVLSGVAGAGWSGPAFIFAVRDTDTAKRDDLESNFGALLTSDWKPKYTAAVLAR
ncbi:MULTISPECIES: cellulase family glycosylhydrolase [unclassified Mycobacterium]|uniref:cellulase family glycosylhydrolase n=1 Tax=unclassified Mycobacterium TaxID=2642494 RepID=UPI000490BB0A|nr:MULTISPECIES: cellulase family glycosylhydrolase [unclassified Mycobacterium]SDZ95345.1 Cellulase (glycosyl hydrolase family 5) [Mycobacterium sp. 283mftsu]